MAGKNKLTFLGKNKIKCPVCLEHFQKEELLTGGGRMIAGPLTDELRREYEPSKKYGEVFPLVYSVMVCPHCFYAAYPQDFPNVPESSLDNIKNDHILRANTMKKLIPDLNFENNRRLQEGVASYHLASMCYELLPKDFSPTFKMAMSVLRAAWLSTNLHKKYPGENWDYMREIYYHKANFLYSLVLEKEVSGAESLGGVTNFGPCSDKNFGYDGVLYLSGLLEYKFGGQGDRQRRLASLQSARQSISRIVGLGKSSKSKPSDILEMARDLHKSIGSLLKELEDGE
ncbi:DUF2225 domain-containing protein [Spirochaeta cellobiosiphila]|uniref:DUF2225 domain-containing protein n=1 Tax=Spirochaeta cellobiosiphila TaxID=504483 RepID=UPI0003FB6B80|nr:DUF2225 domain-containing protein [Spirochaeta cellobiosiphila]